MHVWDPFNKNQQTNVHFGFGVFNYGFGIQGVFQLFLPGVPCQFRPLPPPHPPSWHWDCIGSAGVGEALTRVVLHCIVEYRLNYNQEIILISNY